MKLTPLTDLRSARGAGKLWCGPTLIARALGISYKEAEDHYRRINPVRYMRRKNIVWTFWHETVRILENACVIEPVPSSAGYTEKYGHTINRKTGKYPTLRQWINHAPYGWYAVRTSKHVQIIHVDWQGAHIHDNQRDQQWFPGMKGYSKIRCTNARKLTNM